MKERPIIMSAPMVRAILDGRKSQTRRSVKHVITGPNPPNNYYDLHDRKTGKWLGAHGGNLEFNITNASLLCPYGKPGDRLWVRETWSKAKQPYLSQHIFYRADGESNGKQYALSFVERESKWRSPINMPRLESRILLEVTNVRVERLNDISEEDAIAEGITPSIVGSDLDDMKYRAGFKTLWGSINGEGSWNLNPFVWVIEFKEIK